jgi:hypothetical protein
MNFGFNMRFRFALSCLLLSAAVAHADWNFLDDEAESGGFDVTAQITQAPARFYLIKQENGDGYTLNLNARTLDLNIVQSGKARLITSAPVSSLKAPYNLVIQRRGPRFRVLSGAQTILQAENDLFEEGEIGYQGGTKEVRVQPVEPIVFDDDFMRVASEVALKDALKNPRQGVKIKEAAITETIWSVVKGRWGTTGLAENTEAQVAQSANPFAFRPLDKGDNLSIAGQSFWSDYTNSISVQPQGATEIGILCNVQDEKNFIGLFWSENADPQIRAMVNGVPRVLAQAKDFGPFEQKQWSKIQITAANGTVRAIIDDEEVCRAQTGLFGRGKIGLYARLPEVGNDKTGVGAVFDDANVRSTSDFTDDFTRPVAGRWTPVVGQWSFQNAAKPTTPQGSYAVMGEGAWSDYRVSGQLFTPINGASGLLLHHIPQRGAYIFRVGGSKSTVARSVVQIVRLENGKATVLAQALTGTRFDNARQTWKFEIERGYLSAKIGNQLILDAFDESLTAGRAGVFSQGGSIANFAVEFPVIKSMWAKVPALFEVETQALTMGGWSTPEGFWTKNQGVWEHKGEFFGDSEVKFTYPNVAADKTATLSFGSNKKLVFGPEKLTFGTKTVDIKGAASQNVEVLRRGSLLIVRVGEKAVLVSKI